MTNSNIDTREKSDNESLELLFERLDDILDSLDDRDVPLEEAFKLYEKGIKTVKLCNDKLDNVEKQMQIIMENGEI